VTGPRAVLGVAADATLADVRRAWRVAARRWHPDRIPTRDVVVIAEAERRFLEMRAAYDALVAELSAGRGRSR
jgi:curved DNA-binding protein CbpA